MNQEQISDAMNLLHDNIINETNEVRENKKRSAKKRWLPISLAACLALAVFAGAWFILRDTQELPILSLAPEDMFGGGMGYEGYMAYDISELVGNSPWNEDIKISRLPVYRNSSVYDGDSIKNADYDKMQEILLDIAERLRLNSDLSDVTDNAPDEAKKQAAIDKAALHGTNLSDDAFDPSAVMIEADGVSIQVDERLNALIKFKPAIPLPDYSFTYYSSYEEIATVAEYFKEEYKSVIGFDDPQVGITGGDYDIYLRQHYSLRFFDASGDMATQLVNYYLNYVGFSGGETSELSLIDVNQYDLSDKVGDYPIISVREAKKLLLSGNYITTVPYEVPGEEYVARVELMYRIPLREEYIIPYYRFYVEIPEAERENGLKDYGAFYVPAVQSKYISDMPIWDGSFN